MLQISCILVLALSSQPVVASKPAPPAKKSGANQTVHSAATAPKKDSAKDLAKKSVANQTLHSPPVTQHTQKKESKDLVVTKGVHPTYSEVKDKPVKPQSVQKPISNHFMVKDDFKKKGDDGPNIKVKNVGETISTCGGMEDREGKIQMEQTNGKPCKFPFTYRGQVYNECIKEENNDRLWCFTEFPDEGKTGPIRWGICNVNKEECPATAAHEGVSEARSNVAEKIAAASGKLKVWFEFWYWQPLLFSGLTLMAFCEIAWPLTDWLFGGKQPFLLHSVLFALAMLCFFLMAASMAEPKAAAASHLMGLSTLLVVIAFLSLAGSIGLALRGSKAAKAIADDFAKVHLPLTRLILGFLVTVGVMENVDTDYTGIVTVTAFLVLGLSMAMTGVISDFIAYVFIRADGWFVEGDFIFYNGSIVEVLDIEPRHTKCYCFAHKCNMYIPNGLLGNKELINQSQDNARVQFLSIPLDPNLAGSALEAIVKDVWALLRSQSDFTALNGKKFANQVDIDSCSCCISDLTTTESAKELGQITLSLKLAALYYHSKSEPVDGKTPGPDEWRAHQWDWLAGWNFQKEKILIDVQKILDKNGACKGK